MYKVVLKLDKFFLKYEWGVKLPLPPKEKLPSKNPALLGLTRRAVCGSKKSRFIKEQEASGLLNSLRIRRPLGQTPLVGLFLF